MNWDESKSGRNRIQLTGKGHDITLPTSIKCLPGKLAVELDFEPERLGGLYVPDSVSGPWRGDTGTVVAVGPDIPLTPGDRVAVNGYGGIWVDGGEYGAYMPSGVVVWIGHLESEWWENVFMKEDKKSSVGFVATTNNAILKKSPKIDKQAGLILPDSLHYRSDIAEIVALGEMPNGYDHLQPGMKVVYSHEHIKNFFVDGTKEGEYGVISVFNIHSVIDDD